MAVEIQTRLDEAKAKEGKRDNKFHIEQKYNIYENWTTCFDFSRVINTGSKVQTLSKL